MFNSAMYLNDDGVPVSKRFNDIYFSAHGGLAESMYVYINGNQLKERFKTLSAGDTLNIVELGFGTGLNFLATLSLWRTIASNQAKLSYHAVEGFALNLQEMRQALSTFPELKEEAELMLHVYPDTLHGKYELKLGTQVTLSLYFELIEDAMTQLPYGVDAWYLDGFAPKLNPEMWSEKLFLHMYQTSNTGATFSTFTAASKVRKDLINAGFIVHKRQGFAYKREHLLGIKQSS